MMLALLALVFIGIAIAGADKAATDAMREKMRPFSWACGIFAALVFLTFAIPPLFGR